MVPASRGRIARAGVAAVPRAAIALAAVLLALRGIRWAAGMIGRVTVEGSSMEPALAPGDRLLIVPALRLREGEIVAVPDPRHSGRLLVKRVRSVDRRSRLVAVEGDNADQSTDSRAFGPVRRRAVVGRAVYRYAPPSRVGPIGGSR